MLWQLRNRVLTLGPRCLVMGIVNVTPDSFSDGGQFLRTDAAVAHALDLVRQGADLLDIGGESTRPGSAPITLDEELARVVPVVTALAMATDVPISTDTSKAEVARACLLAGAHIINDVTGLTGDPRMVEVVRELGAGVVVMHMQGTPATMQAAPHYGDVVNDLFHYFTDRLQSLKADGLAPAAIAIDPGIGFGKTREHNIALLARLAKFNELGRPLCLGVSRKGFLGKLLDRPVEERLAGSLAAAAYGLAQEAVQILRVHDVGPTRDLVRVWEVLGKCEITMTTITYAEDLARRARAASRLLAPINGKRKNRWLPHAADALEKRMPEILDANSKDVAAAQATLSGANIDRLTLTPDRIRAAAKGLREIAALPDPVGRILDSTVRPNGLEIHKISVPLGVIFFIYESRPNVTLDAAGLCVKSGNAIILRGGKEALASNTMLHAILQDSLTACELPTDAVQLVNTPERAIVGQLLQLERYIDLAIPRGGESLIRRVAEEATMPVLKHYLGNCHVYVDRAADLAMAERIIVNAKCQRPGVCNAAESLLVHAEIAAAFLPKAAATLNAKGVELRGCPATCAMVPQAKPATDADFAAEFLDLILSVKVVRSLDEAIEHITHFGSQHTETIVTGNQDAARRFTAEVDAAAVMVNASTRFNDGYEFGLGAEIGISTDKFHARGPCGLQELCSYKYVVYGNGQVRE